MVVVVAYTAAAFSVSETGLGGATQSVRSISTTDDVTVTVHLDRIITLKEWTTVVASVEDLNGNAIENFGDMGAKADEPDRMDFGFLPADVNQDGNVNPLDVLRFKQIVNGDPPTTGIDVDYVDINRNGHVNPLDLNALKQLINGISPPATQAWNGKTMNNPRA